MKEGWEYKKFGDLVFFDKRFKGIPRDEQKKIVSFKHVSAETLKGMSVDEGCIKLLSTGLFSGFTTEEIAGDNLNEGEVVTIPTGGNANLKYYKGKFVDSGNILCVAKDDNIYLKFLHYKLLEQNEYIESCFKGTGIHHPFMPDIWNVMIPVPNIAEQQRIVNRLDAAFVKIDSIKANAEKALNEAKALFQASLKEMLEPKEGWEEKKIGEVCELSQGLAINSKTRCLLKETGQLPLLRIKDMKDGTREIFVDEKNCPQSCIANEDDIIYTRTGTLGLVFTGMKGVLHNNCFKIVYNRGLLEKPFLMYYLGHEAFKSKIIKLASRAAQPDITHKLFKAQEIVFPPISEQQSIVATLDSLKSKVDTLQANYDKISQECDALKQAILRQVFE